MPSPRPFYDLFALDLQRVLNDEILSAFAKLEPTPLDRGSLEKLREFEVDNPRARKGLYVLHHNRTPVYVGKADDILSDRLEEHRAKISARLNIDITSVSFRCVYLDKNWSALAHESPLIATMACVWNNNGFGNHDPGRRRDGTHVKPLHFDRLYPINPEVPINVEPAEMSVRAALVLAKEGVPYLLRFETHDGFTPRNSHPEYEAANVTVGHSETAQSLLGKIVDALGPQWQVTFFFGYVILYKENKTYPADSAFKVKRGGAPFAEA
jgi:hypothetical protein